MDSEIPKSEQAEEAAARWFVRQQSGTWTADDQASFDAWLAAATTHRIQYLRVIHLWEQSARMKALGAGVPPGVIPPRGSWGDARFPGGRSGQTLPAGGTEHARRPSGWRTSYNASSRLRLWASAAAAVVVLAGGMYALDVGYLDGTRYSTPIGGIDNVTLADGSQITLNTDTRIRVALDERERRIRLDRGEAFFEVAKDPHRPFVVYVGDKRVMAVGTKFSVRRNQGDVQVVVTEGRVKLATALSESSDGLAQRIAVLVKEATGGEGVTPVSIPSTTFLDAGAVARTSRSEVLVRPSADAEAEKLLSWRIGYVSFDNMTLADAVAEFNRYNEHKIVIEDPAIAAVLVGGNFRSNNSEAFLDLLESGFPIAVERRGDEVILRAR